MNTWWKHQTWTIEPIPIVKCLKHKRPGDTDDLLLMGETLIEFIETKDERMFGVMMKLFGWEGKFGKISPYRCLVSCVGNYETVCEKESLWKFGLDRFMNKGMKERYYFAVWIGMMVWKRDELDSLYAIVTCRKIMMRKTIIKK